MSLDKLIEQRIDSLLTQKLAIVDQALDKALGRLLGTPEPAPAKRARGKATKGSKRAASKRPAAVTVDDVTKALASGPLSAEAIAKATGASTRALRPVLQKLVAGGAVAKTGKQRATRYALPSGRPQ